MSLILPHMGFQRKVSNVNTSSPFAPVGQTVTAGGSANTDGTDVSLLSALAFDAVFIVVYASACNTNGAAASTLLDILTDPAGGTAWTEKIADIAIGQLPTIGALYCFPLFIPAGSSVGARMRSSTASQTASIAIGAYGDPVEPAGWWCGTAVETLGATPESSTVVEVATGTSPAVGAWTTIGTSTRDYGALVIACNGEQDAAGGAAVEYYYEVGVNDSPIALPAMHLITGTSEQTTRSSSWGFCCYVAGTVFQMRGATSTGTDAMCFGLHGVY